MRIIASAQMGHGTFQAKFLPLSHIKEVDEIIVIRKQKGPSIPKLIYICPNRLLQSKYIYFFWVLYKLISLGLLKKSRFFLAYHFVPHAILVYFASIFTRIPFIYAQTGGDIENKSKKKVYKFLIHKVLKRAVFILTPGNESKKHWIAQGIDNEKIIVLHSTINTNKIIPGNISLDIDFLYVGSLRPRKNVDRIIKSFKTIINQHPNSVLGIVGNGILEEELNDLVHRLKIENNVRFFGFQENVLQYLNRAKVFVMASDVEGLPVALMEAMSAEKLVIAPLVNNIPSVLIDYQTGFGLKRNNELKETMLNALTNFEKYIHLRKRAREIIVNNYSYNVAIQKWKKILKNL